MVTWLEHLFPNLRGTDYQITSASSDVYNCVGWAVGDITSWWWPVGKNRAVYWPDGVPREETVAAFFEMFTSVGFIQTSNDDAEAEFEVIALFAGADGKPTHAARRMPTGRWTSKLGQAEVIEHDLRALEGELYGKVVLFMKRAK